MRPRARVSDGSAERPVGPASSAKGLCARTEKTESVERALQGRRPPSSAQSIMARSARLSSSSRLGRARADEIVDVAGRRHARAPRRAGRGRRSCARGPSRIPASPCAGRGCGSGSQASPQAESMIGTRGRVPPVVADDVEVGEAELVGGEFRQHRDAEPVEPVEQRARLLADSAPLEVEQRRPGRARGTAGRCRRAAGIRSRPWPTAQSRSGPAPRPLVISVVKGW